MPNSTLKPRPVREYQCLDCGASILASALSVALSRKCSECGAVYAWIRCKPRPQEPIRTGPPAFSPES